MPGVGSAVGTFAGGILGGILGTALAKRSVEAIDKIVKSEPKSIKF
jgi:Na+/glutamate symporter